MGFDSRKIKKCAVCHCALLSVMQQAADVKLSRKLSSGQKRCYGGEVAVGW